MKEKIKETEITQRFITALDRLVQDDNAASEREICLSLGIHSQKITKIKRYLKEGDQPNYISITDIYSLSEKYGVSVHWLLLDEGTFYEKDRQMVEHMVQESRGPYKFPEKEKTKLKEINLEDEIVQIKKMIDGLLIKIS